MQPRLRLDIGWTDLLSAVAPAGRDADAFERAIAARAPADTHAVTALSVRTLFDAILAETGTRPVVMSAVTIEDMATLTRASGRALRAVDIDIKTLSPTPNAIRAACIGSDAGVVVIAHLFGSRAPTEAIAAACAGQGRLIVEDCAQAFDGKLSIAPGADVALYSFGPIKVATALGGAVGLFRNGELADRVRRRLDAYPALPERWFIRRAIKYMGLKILNLVPVYTLLLILLRLVGRDPDEALGSMARGFSAGLPITQAVRRRPPRRLLRLLARRLDTWSPQPDATPNLLQRLSSHLTVPGLTTSPRRWWLAPVLARHPDRLIATLRAAGFDATRGATSMRPIRGDDEPMPDEAARMIASIVYLPKPTSLPIANRLADCVEAALARDEMPASALSC